MATNKSIRIPGQAVYASNFEVAKQALLDAREMILTTAADLVKPETWEDEDGNVWLAKGLKVAVMNDGGTPELYILKDPDNYTSPDSWHKVGDTEALAPIVLNIPEESIEGILSEDIQNLLDYDLGVSFDELKAAAQAHRSIWMTFGGREFNIPTTVTVGSNNVVLTLPYTTEKTLVFTFTPSTQSGKVNVDVREDVLSKDSLGLGNVTNDAQVKRSEMGVANGVATLGADGKVPTAQLPSYVDDVIDLVAIYPAKGNIPTSGLTVGAKYFITSENRIYTATSATAVGDAEVPEAGKIYVVTSKPANATADVNTTWRWSGTAMAQVGSSLVLGTVTGTAFDGGKGQALQTWKESVDGMALVTGAVIGTRNATGVTVGLTRSSLVNGAAATSTDVVIPVATTSASGVMAAADKSKLDALPTASDIVTSVVLEVETI